jgi:hypothetical protein
MKLVTVKLEHVEGEVIVCSDVYDSLGRLLLKAPKEIDDNMKRILFNRGIREIVIQDRRETERVEDQGALDKELEALERRLVNFSENETCQDFKELIKETFFHFYESRKTTPRS